MALEPPRGMDWPEDFQFGLSKFSIGIWRSRGHYSLSVLVNRRCNKFVVLVDVSKPGRLPSRVVKSAQIYHDVASKTASLFNGSFPFSREKQKQSVLAFEIAWADIVGMDYRNPLCEDGRLVLEARQVTKREFGSMSDVQMFYMVTPPSSPRMSAQHHQQAPLAPASFGSPFLPLSAHQREPANKPAARPASEPRRRKGEATSANGERAPGTPVELLSAASRLKRRTQPTRSGSDGEMPALLTPLARKLHRELQAHAAGNLGSLQDAMPKGSKVAACNLQGGAASDSLPSSRAVSPPPPLRIRLSSPDLALPGSSILEDKAVPKSPSAAKRSGRWSVDQAGMFHLNVVHEAPPCMPTGSWPPPARWTKVAEVYSNRTIVLSFSNPVLPLALESVFGGDKRLLRLYESGLPSWAVFLPTYGCWYHPWMRKVTFYLFILISLISLALGFYDLYKNVPFFQTMMRNLVGNMYLPLFQWLEEHTKVRLSIFLTYLFGKSELFLPVMQLLSRIFGSCRALLAPFAGLASQIFLPFWQAAAATASMSWGFARLFWKLFEPLAMGVMVLLMEPLMLAAQAIRFAVSLLAAAMALLRQCLGVFVPAWRTWVPALQQGAAAASQATRAARPAASAVAAAGFNANYWRTLIIKVANAVKSIANFAIYCACSLDRHRKSMAISAWQRWGRLKAKVAGHLQPHMAVIAELAVHLITVLDLFSGLSLFRGPSAGTVSLDSAEIEQQIQSWPGTDLGSCTSEEETTQIPDIAGPISIGGADQANLSDEQLAAPNLLSIPEPAGSDDEAHEQPPSPVNLMYRSKSMSPRISLRKARRTPA